MEITHDHLKALQHVLSRLNGRFFDELTDHDIEVVEELSDLLELQLANRNFSQEEPTPENPF